HLADACYCAGALVVTAAWPHLPVQACARTRTAFANQTTFNYAAQLLQLPPQGTVWTPEIGMMIKALWNDPGARPFFFFVSAHFHDDFEVFAPCMGRRARCIS